MYGLSSAGLSFWYRPSLRDGSVSDDRAAVPLLLLGMGKETGASPSAKEGGKTQPCVGI